MELEKRPNVQGTVRGPKGDVQYTLYHRGEVKYHTEVRHPKGKGPTLKLRVAENAPELREQAAKSRVLATLEKEEEDRRKEATRSDDTRDGYLCGT